MDIPSQTLPGLVWTSTPHPEGDVTWTALWQGQEYASATELAAVLDEDLRTPAQQFEAWLAFGLGLDGFAPVLSLDEWTALFDRGPVDVETGEADGVAVPAEHRILPHQGSHGLEGLVVHTASGHVMRAMLGGLPPTLNMPLLVALTVESKKDEPTVESTP